VTTGTFQLFDALPAHVEDALRVSIERFGVLVPVAKDQHGNMIDGHHRARIADALGVRYRVDVMTVADDDEVA
jgi:ParB-like chromosome segregation protein Spo0J